MRTIPIIVLAGIAIGAAATAGSVDRSPGAALARATAGLVAGKPQTCLANWSSNRLEADGPNLIYRVSRSRVYVNTTRGGCERVAQGDTLVTVSPQGQLCRGDLARTVDQVARFPTGNCALGDFVRYTKPKS